MSKCVSYKPNKEEKDTDQRGGWQGGGRGDGSGREIGFQLLKLPPIGQTSVKVVLLVSGLTNLFHA